MLVTDIWSGHFNIGAGIQTTVAIVVTLQIMLGFICTIRSHRSHQLTTL